MNNHQRLIYWLAILDGIALLTLIFIAVPVKYLLGVPLAVTIIGPMHGGLFTLLTLALGTALIRGGIKPSLATLLFFGALLPLGAFYADRKLKQAYETSVR